MTETTEGRLAADLEILAELFKAGGWSELRLESRGLSLLLSKDAATPALGRARTEPPSVHATPALTAAKSAPSPDPVRSLGGAVAIDDAWSPVSAPNLGTFYRSPKPGAANFVEVGQRVEATTEICLIEVMKLFTSVQAGIAGTVRHIAVADAELVQGGQVLIFIERE